MPNIKPNPSPAANAYPDRLNFDFGCIATIFRPLSARLFHGCTLKEVGMVQLFRVLSLQEDPLFAITVSP